jgi:hypothetical protein
MTKLDFRTFRKAVNGYEIPLTCCKPCNQKIILPSVLLGVSIEA